MDVQQWCHELMKQNDWCILDTETTGVETEDEIIEIAIIDGKGEVLLDQMVRPFRHINPRAQEKHGISKEMLVRKPSFAQVLPQIIEVLSRFKRIIVYNAEFDHRLFRQSVKKAGAQVFMSPGGKDLLERSTAEQKYWLPVQWVCFMEIYAQHWGELGHRGYKWQKLELACYQQEVQVDGSWHRAQGDCQATLALIKTLASQYEERTDKTPTPEQVKIQQIRDKIDKDIAQLTKGPVELEVGEFE